MIPRNKAIEIQRKMYDAGSKDSNEVYRESAAKKCALVFVDSLIELNVLRSMQGLSGNPNTYPNDTIQYWEEVKNELTRL